MPPSWLASGALRGPVRLRTFVSLDCTNCPDVVQALNPWHWSTATSSMRCGMARWTRTRSAVSASKACPPYSPADSCCTSARPTGGAARPPGGAPGTDRRGPAGRAAFSRSDGGRRRASRSGGRDLFRAQGPEGGAGQRPHRGQVQDTLGIENLISVPPSRARSWRPICGGIGSRLASRCSTTGWSSGWRTANPRPSTSREASAWSRRRSSSPPGRNGASWACLARRSTSAAASPSVRTAMDLRQGEARCRHRRRQLRSRGCDRPRRHLQPRHPAGVQRCPAGGCGSAAQAQGAAEHQRHPQRPHPRGGGRWRRREGIAL